MACYIVTSIKVPPPLALLHLQQERCKELTNTQFIAPMIQLKNAL